MPTAPLRPTGSSLATLRGLCGSLGLLLALAGPAEAQRELEASQAPTPVLGQRLKTGGTPVVGNYDLDTGAVELLTSNAARLAAGCFNNSFDDDLYADALLYPPGFELFDWGVKGCGKSELVDRIRIGYASTAKPVRQGGPGAVFTLRLYSDATGNGQPGRLVKEIPLSGLPAAGLEPSGLLIPSYVTLMLGSESFVLPDGAIGWSYENADGKSAPLLVDVVPSTGTANAYDVYQPGPASAASYQGTFTLGPGGSSNDPKENSFHIELFQNDVLATVAPIPGQGNPDLFRAGRAVIGRTWYGHVDLSGLAGVSISLVAISHGRQTGVITPEGEWIVDPSSLLREVSVGVLDAHRFAVPRELGLLGWTIYAQGGYVGRAGLQLTNGAALTIGSY